MYRNRIAKVSGVIFWAFSLFLLFLLGWFILKAGGVEATRTTTDREVAILVVEFVGALVILFSAIFGILAWWLSDALKELSALEKMRDTALEGAVLASEVSFETMFSYAESQQIPITIRRFFESTVNIIKKLEENNSRILPSPKQIMLKALYYSLDPDTFREAILLFEDLLKKKYGPLGPAERDLVLNRLGILYRDLPLYPFSYRLCRDEAICFEKAHRHFLRISKHELKESSLGTLYLSRFLRNLHNGNWRGEDLVRAAEHFINSLKHSTDFWMGQYYLLKTVDILSELHKIYLRRQRQAPVLWVNPSLSFSSKDVNKLKDLFIEKLPQILQTNKGIGDALCRLLTEVIERFKILLLMQDSVNVKINWLYCLIWLETRRENIQLWNDVFQGKFRCCSPKIFTSLNPQRLLEDLKNLYEGTKEIHNLHVVYSEISEGLILKEDFEQDVQRLEEWLKQQN